MDMNPHNDIIIKALASAGNPEDKDARATVYAELREQLARTLKRSVMSQKDVAAQLKDFDAAVRDVEKNVTNKNKTTATDKKPAKPRGKAFAIGLFVLLLLAGAAFMEFHLRAEKQVVEAAYQAEQDAALLKLTCDSGPALFEIFDGKGNLLRHEQGKGGLFRLLLQKKQDFDPVLVYSDARTFDAKNNECNHPVRKNQLCIRKFGDEKSTYTLRSFDLLEYPVMLSYEDLLTKTPTDLLIFELDLMEGVLIVQNSSFTEGKMHDRSTRIMTCKRDEE